MWWLYAVFCASLSFCSNYSHAHTHTSVLYVRAILKRLLLARGLCSEARGSTFSNTPIYFMTSPQRRLNFSHAWLGGFQLGTEHSASREVTLQQSRTPFAKQADGNVFTPLQRHRLFLPNSG